MANGGMGNGASWSSNTIQVQNVAQHSTVRGAFISHSTLPISLDFPFAPMYDSLTHLDAHAEGEGQRGNDE